MPLVQSRRSFVTNLAWFGAMGLTGVAAARHTNASEPNLTGSWVADDGAVYYIHHLANNKIWWAGLHSLGSGFHPGVAFTNVYHGTVDPVTKTIHGEWADVPRGMSLGHGLLGLDIVEVSTPAGGGVPPHPPIGDGRPPNPPEPLTSTHIELRQRPQETTGGFGARNWQPWPPGLSEPFEIKKRFQHVRRYDSQFERDNTPYKDWAVIFGKIASSDPPYLNWEDPNRDYCTFLGVGLPGYGRVLDGEVNFNIMDPVLDSNFWNAGWLNPSSFIQAHLTHNGNQFHNEIVMFGRTNNEDDCRADPNVLLPGWMETGGSSVLINGQPVNGNVIFPMVLAGPSTVPPTVGFRVIDRSATPSFVALTPGLKVRVTGVINLDEHERDEGFPDFKGAPEVDPVYSVDVLQDFTEPRLGADLTGVWHASDIGTYYLRQVDGNMLWWLGMSRDQGRTFANVFHGAIFPVAGVIKGSPPGWIISGEWADVPLGRFSSAGRLQVQGGLSPDPFSTEIAYNVSVTAPKWTVLATRSTDTGAFANYRWGKLYDRSPFR